MKRLDVIIPTRDRIPALSACLDSIERQTLDKKEFEVIIVDDGSALGTRERYPALVQNHSFPITLLQNEGKGPARGRNLAIDQATADIVLILNDDLILIPGHFRVHLDYHARRPDKTVCVRGKSVWDPKIPDTSLMRYIRKIHLRYDIEVDESIRELAFFHTMDISFKRQLLQENRFDEDFPYPSVEDTELGWRLKKKGLLTLYVTPEVLSYHCHRITARSLIHRAKISGYSAAIILKKHPDLYELFLGRVLRTSNKKRLLNILKALVTFRGEELWENLESFFYLRTLLQARKRFKD